jgi:hypothetical protein
MEGVQSAGDCNGGGYVLQQQTATVGAMLGLRLVCRINSSTDSAAGTQALWKRNRRDTMQLGGGSNVVPVLLVKVADLDAGGFLSPRYCAS